MRIVLAVVGRPKDDALAAAIRAYETRAARYWPLELIEVREERAGSGVTPAHVRDKEGERLRERTTGVTALVACDPGGLSMASEQFADWLQERRERAQDVAFVIGGAYGLSDAIRQAATLRLSLAPWTLPHELARLVLAEQLYRAGTIVRGEPYHK
jgi:23S rRNA (pseudouridine1915-N3)-methyltransferase